MPAETSVKHGETLEKSSRIFLEEITGKISEEIPGEIPAENALKNP